ncbi:helix-turn-helix domain-containing protein [Dietzia sp. CH92]|uniref:TetR/AcrR family transcriptional regulator n=1 Tax=Dietzia sp. CH92 TaxID=3051823 RepID=UPI0028D3CD84|nr:helix-turn-helix domain-containing protein [Dietzia sp. CH92]
MESSSETTSTLGEVWTTPRVAEFLGISRQAINKRVQNRKMLGYPGSGKTLFPTWQFDMEDRGVRPEVLEYLEAFDESIPSDAIAQWSVTPQDDYDRSPAELLLDPSGRDDALRLAHSCQRAALRELVGPTPEVEGTRNRRDVAEWTPTSAGETGAQHAILLAAADLFARKGPAKVSLREVAAAAGVSYGLIHRFYRTKENLLVAVMGLLVNYGGERLTSEADAYAAIENSFGADLDAGQFGRMLAWAIFEGTEPKRLLGGVRSRGYRSQIEALWQDPVEPEVRREFDSNVLASLLALVGSVWDLYEPYLAELADTPDRDARDVRDEVTDMLKLLVYATRPDR